MEEERVGFPAELGEAGAVGGGNERGRRAPGGAGGCHAEGDGPAQSL